MTDRRVRIGLIGLGMMGRAHLKVLQACPDMVVVAASDPSPAAQAIARQNTITGFADYRAMLDAGGLDGVIVASPNAEHVPAGLAAIEHGIAVLVEKPLADTVEGGRRLADASKRSGVPVLVGHHRRHNGAVQAARRVVQEGLIGTPSAVSILSLLLKPDSYFHLEWRREAGSGGPVLINLIHEIDLVRFVFGEIVSLQAMTSSAVRKFAVEDTVAVLLRFASGAIGTITLSDTAATPYAWDIASGEFDLMTNMTGKLGRQAVATHVFAGTAGSLTLPTLDFYNYSGETEPGWLSRLQHATLTPTSTDTAYDRQMAHFARVARREEAPLLDARDGLRTLAATLAVRASAETGRAVDLVSGDVER